MFLATLRSRGELRRFFHHNVGIRAADSEGADSCKARRFAGLPIAILADGGKRAVGEIDARVRRLVMKQRRDFLVAELLDRLDQSGHSGGAIEVADVGLAGADRAERISLGSAFAEGLGESGDFDRIT